MNDQEQYLKAAQGTKPKTGVIGIWSSRLAGVGS